MTERSSNDEQLERLTAAVASRECVAFIGSGLSMHQYGDWRLLVNQLCKRCLGVSNMLHEESTVDEHLDAAEDALRGDEATYYQTLGDILGQASTTNPLYRVLVASPFQCYVTANLDPLLANEAKDPRNKLVVEAYPTVLDASNIRERKDGTRWIFHIHGIIQEGQRPQKGDIVLARSEFDAAYDGKNLLPSFLAQLLSCQNIVFIGCKLKEPALERVFKQCDMILGGIVAKAGGRRPDRYILLPAKCLYGKDPGAPGLLAAEEDRRLSAENEKYESMGISVVRYPLGNNEDHVGLTKLLEKMSSLSRGIPMRRSILEEDQP